MVAFTSFDLDPFNETTLLTEMGWALGVMCELLQFEINIKLNKEKRR